MGMTRHKTTNSQVMRRLQLCDLSWLRSRKRPANNTSGQTIRLVDLFSGCGGVFLRVTEARVRAGVGAGIAFALPADGESPLGFLNNFSPKRNDLLRIEPIV